MNTILILEHWTREPAGHPGTEDLVPGYFLLLLSRDKGTAGQGIFFVPGQRDSGTRKLFCPGTKGQWDVPRDVPSL